jgi:hypothetical protein
MQSWILGCLALTVPCIWGVIAHWMLQRIWPHGVSTSGAARPRIEPVDYQI